MKIQYCNFENCFQNSCHIFHDGCLKTTRQKTSTLAGEPAQNSIQISKKFVTMHPSSLLLPAWIEFLYLIWTFSLLMQFFLCKLFDHVGILKFFHLVDGIGVTALILLYFSFILFQLILASYVFLVLQLFTHCSSVSTSLPVCHRFKFLFSSFTPIFFLVAC